MRTLGMIGVVSILLGGVAVASTGIYTNVNGHIKTDAGGLFYYEINVYNSNGGYLRAEADGSFSTHTYYQTPSFGCTYGQAHVDVECIIRDVLGRIVYQHTEPEVLIFGLPTGTVVNFKFNPTNFSEGSDSIRMDDAVLSPNSLHSETWAGIKTSF